MQKLLLQCSNLEDAQKVKADLESRLPYQVVLSFGKNETENLLLKQGVQLFILDTKKFSHEELQFLVEIRNLGYIYPVLVLAEKVREMAVVGSKFKAHVLEKPYDPKALLGVTRKLMVQKAINQQIHKRFKTHQSTKIESYITAETHDSKMFNLSRGGAYVELLHKPAISVGDLVRVQVPLAEVDRQHEVNAKVIWTTRKGAYSGGFGVGLRFVAEREVYRQVMEKM